MPDEAGKVFEKCINEKALVLSGKVTRCLLRQGVVLKWMCRVRGRVNSGSLALAGFLPVMILLKVILWWRVAKYIPF